MHTKRTRVWSALLVLACAGMLVASIGSAQATIDSEVGGNPPVQGTDPDASSVDCEDPETGVVTPGPCPEVGPGPEVQGNGQSASGSSSSAALPSDPNDPTLVGAVSTPMKLTLDIDALGRDRWIFDAPAKVFIGHPRGGSIYKQALVGEGGLRGIRVPQDWGVTLSFTSGNVILKTCTFPGVVNGDVSVWSGYNEVPGLGVYAVVTGKQIFTQATRRNPAKPTTLFNPLKPFTISFTCDVR